MKKIFTQLGLVALLAILSINFVTGQEWTDGLDRSDAPGITAYTTAGLKSASINQTFDVHIIFASNYAMYNTVTNRMKIIAAMNGLYKTQTDAHFAYSGNSVASSSSLDVKDYKFGQIHPECFIVLIQSGTSHASLGYPVISMNYNTAIGYPQDTREHFTAHELGHAFGLQHTFYGSKINHGDCEGVYGELYGNNCDPVSCGDGTSQCRETYNSSNGTTCGDFCSDTKGDPGTEATMLNGGNLSPLSDFSICNDCKDPNNHVYDDPPFQNIMSYYGCQNSSFSDQQKKIMHNIADSDGWSRLKTTFSPSGVPTEMYFGDEVTVSLILPSQSKHISQHIGLNHATGYYPRNVTCTRYNNGTYADLEVVGTNEGTEELEFYITYPKVYRSSTTYTVKLTYEILIEDAYEPPAPTISDPFSVACQCYVVSERKHLVFRITSHIAIILKGKLYFFKALFTLNFASHFLLLSI